MLRASIVCMDIQRQLFVNRYKIDEIDLCPNKTSTHGEAVDLILQVLGLSSQKMFRWRLSAQRVRRTFCDEFPL